jgi:hypothetical protein
MFYSKLPKEIPQIKKIALGLVSSWSRPILGQSISYKDLSNALAHSSQPRRVSLNESRGGSAEMPERLHARIPKKANFDFVKQPVSHVVPQEKLMSEQFRKLTSHLQRLKSTARNRK